MCPLVTTTIDDARETENATGVREKDNRLIVLVTDLSKMFGSA